MRIRIRIMAKVKVNVWARAERRRGKMWEVVYVCIYPTAYANSKPSLMFLWGVLILKYKAA